MKKRFLATFAVSMCLLLLGAFVPIRSAAASAPHMAVEKPANNAVISSAVANVLSGWAVNSSGIKQVDLKIDGGAYKKITYGVKRTDIAKSYSSYPGASASGFTYTIAAGQLKTGKHTLTVRAVGKNSTTQTVTRTVQVKALKTAGKLETPSSGQAFSTGSAIVFKGWALNISGIARVDVLIDGKIKKSATIGITRNDIASSGDNKYYPNAAKGGFQYTLPANSLGAGTHSVKVTAVGKNGTTQSFTRSFKVSAAHMAVEAPANSAVLSSAVAHTLSGFAVNTSGIKQVELKIDGGAYKKITYGVKRTDIAKSYPAFPGASASGFTYTIAAGQLKTGSHTLTVRAVGKDNTTQTVTRTVQVKALKTAGNLETPSSGQSFSADGAIPFKGWALNISGVSRVDVLIDGKIKKSATIGITRNDIASSGDNKYYPNAAKGGFQYTLPAYSLGVGSHSVKVTAVGKNGTTQSFTRSFKVSAPAPHSGIDAPAGGAGYADNKNITVKGWAVNWGGASTVSLYLDGAKTAFATASTNLSNPAVYSKYAHYAGASKAGYSVTVPISKFSSGTHTVKAVATGKNGSSTASVTFKVQRYQMGLDTAAVPKYLLDTLNLTGWAVNGNGVKSVQLFVDGTLKASTSTGLATAGVPSAFSAYPNAAKSGFAFKNLDIKSLAAGSHTFTVKALGQDGTAQSVSFSAKKQAPVTVIEQVTDKDPITGIVTVSGYALNATGLRSVTASVDGGAAVAAQLVPNAGPVGEYEGYKNIGQSGFTVGVKISANAAGLHKIVVTATGTDGTVCTATEYAGDSETSIYTHYDLTLSDMEAKQLTLKPGPACSYGGGWKYLSTVKNGYYYYKANAGGGSTYTWVSDTAAYNSIFSTFVYYLNPMNLEDDPTDRYQFMRLTYFEGVSASGLNSFFDARYALNGLGQCFIDAGKASNVSPVYLAMHAIEETGNGSSALAKYPVKAGTYKVGKNTYTVAKDTYYYNFFGINATDEDPVLGGASCALANGWDTPEKAVRGGADWIARNYINSLDRFGSGTNQNTLYKMRWNPDEPGSSQYASDVRWAHNSAALIKKYFDKYPTAGILYDIPVYKQ